MILLVKRNQHFCEEGHIAWKGRQVSQHLHLENTCSEAELWNIHTACCFSAGREEILREVVHTALVTTRWISVPTRWTEGWVEATKKSTELSSGRDMKHRVRGLCLDTRGISQRKQMNKSADGEVKRLDHLDSWQYLQHSLWMGREAGFGVGDGDGDPEKALTKFKMTAYISMDF